LFVGSTAAPAATASITQVWRECRRSWVGGRPRYRQNRRPACLSASNHCLQRARSRARFTRRLRSGLTQA
jgi:hypothetical protein